MKITLFLALFCLLPFSAFAAEVKWPYSTSGNLGAQYVFTGRTLTPQGQELIDAVSNRKLDGCLKKVTNHFSKAAPSRYTGQDTICTTIVTVKINRGEDEEVELSRLAGQIGHSTFDRIILIPMLAAEARKNKECGDQNPYLHRLWKAANMNSMWCE